MNGVRTRARVWTRTGSRAEAPLPGTRRDAGPPTAVDVVVAGGGPAGAATAARLARPATRSSSLERNPAGAGGPAACSRRRRPSPSSAPSACRPGAARRRAAHPGDARGDAGGHGLRADLRRGGRRRRRPWASTDRRWTRPSSTAPAPSGVDVRTRRRRARGGARRPPPGHARPRGRPARSSRDSRRAVGHADGVLVGADGPRSIVAAAAGMTRPPRLAARVGLSWHVADEPGDEPKAARDGRAPRRRLLRPRPGARRAAERRHRAGGTAWQRSPRPRRVPQPRASTCCARSHRSSDDPEAWREGMITDAIAGASPLGCRVDAACRPRLAARRRRGRVPGPVHRARASTAPSSRPGWRPTPSTPISAVTPAGLAAYDRAMRDRFATKDRLSLLVQAFLARPPCSSTRRDAWRGKPDIRAHDGPRDGRPRSCLPRASTRGSSPRCSSRDRGAAVTTERPSPSSRSTFSDPTAPSSASASAPMRGASATARSS